MIQQEIAILKELKKKKPWVGTHAIKRKKFTWLLEELCLLHDLKIPKLIIPKPTKKFKWTKKYCGDCCLYPPKIRIKNFSVITFLHEFKHWIDLHNSSLKWKPKQENEKREYDAYYYSTHRFYTVWPERITTLNEFMNSNIFETKKALSKMKKMKRKYQKTNIDYKLRAETCAVLDIVLGEPSC